jgi:hypothetical protein
MRNAVLALLVCSASVPVRRAALLARQAKAPRTSRLAQPSKPRDARTRAKLHTELGALYLQANQLAWRSKS